MKLLKKEVTEETKTEHEWRKYNKVEIERSSISTLCWNLRYQRKRKERQDAAKYRSQKSYAKLIKCDW